MGRGWREVVTHVGTDSNGVSRDVSRGSYSAQSVGSFVRPEWAACGQYLLTPDSQTSVYFFRLTRLASFHGDTAFTDKTHTRANHKLVTD